MPEMARRHARGGLGRLPEEDRDEHSQKRCTTHQTITEGKPFKAEPSPGGGEQLVICAVDQTTWP